MEIFLCKQCGLIGIDVELICLDTIVINNGNNFASKGCPNCKSTLIYYRSKPAIFSHPTYAINEKTPFIEPAITTPEHPEEESLPDKIIFEVFEEISRPALSTTGQVKPNRVRNTGKKIKKNCDVCNKQFTIKESEREFSVRCKKCLDETMEKITKE